MMNIKNFKKQLEHISNKLFNIKHIVESFDDCELKKQYSDNIENIYFLKQFDGNDDMVTLLDVLYSSYDVYNQIEEEYLRRNCDSDLERSRLYCTFIAGMGGLDCDELAQFFYQLYKDFFTKSNVIKSYDDSKLTIELNDHIFYSKMLITNDLIYKVIRISPFSKKKQTSYIKIHFYHINNHLNSIEINDSDLEYFISKSSGPGGQHANKTESKVRVVHKPTMISVVCSETRSQISNKTIALDRLRAKISEMYRIKKLLESQKSYNELAMISWSNFDRIVNLHKDQFVKDAKYNIKISIQKFNDINLGELCDLYFHNYLLDLKK